MPKACPKKILIQMITLIAVSRFIPMKANYETKKKGTTMNPITHFKKIRILRNKFFSLSAIFALATTAHAQNLYVSTHTPGTGEYHHSILEFTPSGVQSTYASR